VTTHEFHANERARPLANPADPPMNDTRRHSPFLLYTAIALAVVDIILFATQHGHAFWR
jgi:hypothetical protein